MKSLFRALMCLTVIVITLALFKFHHFDAGLFHTSPTPNVGSGATVRGFESPARDDPSNTRQYTISNNGKNVRENQTPSKIATKESTSNPRKLLVENNQIVSHEKKMEIKFVQNKSVKNVTNFSNQTSSNYNNARGETKPTKETCPFPRMDPYHPVVMKYFVRNPTVDCRSGVPSLVHVDGDYLVFNETKARLYNVTIDHCTYTPLILRKGSDHYAKDPIWSSPFQKFIKFPDTLENMLTVCMYRKKIVSQTFTTLVKERSTTEGKCQARFKRHVEKNSPKETMSVLLVGIDGVSRNNFIRSMPKTRKFIINQLHAMEINKLNKAGDNTLPNLAAFLAGSTMNQLRENFSSYDEYFDKIDHKFIWKPYSDAGYRVGFILDRAIISAFHYQKKGWNKPIFDYYHRPAVVRWDKDRTARKASELCVGQVPEVTHLFDYWHQLTAVFNNTKSKPYFGYSFFCHLTHDDPNLTSAGDELYLDFFQKLKKRNVLENTILVFFSDHGARFGPFRATYNGLLETRNPMMFFIFPDWFKKKYPEVMKTFRTNQQRLTTFFDVHATLKDILHFAGKPGTPASTSEKAISLFREIPSNRTCRSAGISMNYCLCTQSSNVEAPRHLWKVMGERMLSSVISATASVRDKCYRLRLVSVNTVVTLSDDRPNQSRSFFRAIIETAPGGAIYEGMLEHSHVSRVTSLRSVPSRLNLYRGQAECVQAEEVRPFCVCRDLFSTPSPKTGNLTRVG